MINGPTCVLHDYFKLKKSEMRFRLHCIAYYSPVHSRLESLHCVQVDVPIVTPDCEHSSHNSGNPDSPTGGGQLGHVLPAMHSRVKALYGAQGGIVIKTTFRTDKKVNY